MRRTLVQRFIGDVRVVLRGARVTEEDFEAHIEEALRRRDSMRAVLVVLVGHGPAMLLSAHERVRLSQAGLFTTPCAVLAPSVQPEAVTGTRWIGADMRSFGPDDLELACDFLVVAPELRPQLSRAIEEMKRELAG